MTRTLVRGLFRKLGEIFDRRTKALMVLATAASVFIALLDTVAIALVLPLVNLATGHAGDMGGVQNLSQLLGEPDQRTLTLILAATVVMLFILKDLGAVAYAWWLAGFKALQRVELSSRLLRYFLSAPYTTVADRGPGELIRTMNDAVVQLFGTTVYSLMNLAGSAISILAIVAALLISAPVPTLALTVYFGTVSFIYIHWVKPKAKEAGVNAADASAEAWRAALASLGGLKEAHLRNSAEHFVARYKEASNKEAHASRTAEILNVLPRYLLEILFISAVGVILGLGIVMNPGSGGAGESLGLLALFVAAGFRVLPSVTGLLNHINSLRFGARFLDLVLAEVRAERATPRIATSPPTDQTRFDNALSLHDVSFRYPGADVDALKSVTLTIPKGSVVAFVGGSGAGKTTLVDVILGLHPPTQGQIQVDGLSIEQNIRGWQSLIGYVPQDVYLFESTLAENIAFDTRIDDIDTGRLSAAVQAAQLAELVESLPDGLSTQVGERGVRLSGGQRQRVGVARALYREPTVLVLDEATSALDNETEYQLSREVYALRGDMTVLIVAHRLSTVQNADTIIFMEGGRVRATGTFNEIRERDQQFARLVALGALPE